MEEKEIIGPKIKLSEVMSFMATDTLVMVGIGITYWLHLKYKIFHMAKDVLLIRNKIKP